MLRLDTQPRPEAAPTQPAAVLELVERMGWMIGLRWRAVAMITAVIVIAIALGVVSDGTMLLALAAMHALGNVVFRRMATALATTESRERLENFLGAQILFDLVILMALLHFSGGADNPFMMLSVFHMAFAGMLLPIRKALFIGLCTGALYATMVLAEGSGLLAFHALRLGVQAGPPGAPGVPLWMSPMFMLAYLSAFGLTEIGVILFVHNLVRRIREAEALRRDHERVALARERLARIGSLAAGVAHTIRNPLHGVLSCVDMLQKRLDRSDASTAEILDLMSEGVGRIENVTSRLLVLTREAPSPRVPVDLRILVQDAMQFAELRARNRGVQIHVEFEDVPPLPLDAERLTEAVTNVLDNAIDACAEDDRITVRILHKPPPGAGARIEIEDTGEGIPDSELANIFDPFFTTKPIGEGTGLGLAITRQVVEDHDGDIHVVSRVGGGTTVRIDLPVAEDTRLT